MENVHPQFSIVKTFNASKKAVFEAFSSSEALAEWWGPVEAPIDVIKLDFKPGGIFHYRMNGKTVNYGVFNYREINEPDNITWINSFADENAVIIKPPFPGIDFPKEILNTITLDEHDGVTTLTLTAQPVNATEEEAKTFYQFAESMQNGFGGTFNQLANYLTKTGLAG